MSNIKLFGEKQIEVQIKPEKIGKSSAEAKSGYNNG